jgi:hypothetical protein
MSELALRRGLQSHEGRLRNSWVGWQDQHGKLQCAGVPGAWVHDAGASKNRAGGEIQHLTHGQTGSYKPAVLRVGEVQREGGVDVVVSFAVGITGSKDGINFERDETDAKPQKTKWPSNGCAALTD